jgi:hypothetical protein
MERGGEREGSTSSRGFEVVADRIAAPARLKANDLKAGEISRSILVGVPFGLGQVSVPCGPGRSTARGPAHISHLAMGLVSKKNLPPCKVTIFLVIASEVENN